jgi:hypothetical protein
MWRIRARPEVTTSLNARRPTVILYWSQQVGWTWKDYATTYTEAEKDRAFMPPGGLWEEVHE